MSSIILSYFNFSSYIESLLYKSSSIIPPPNSVVEFELTKKKKNNEKMLSSVLMSLDIKERF